MIDITIYNLVGVSIIATMIAYSFEPLQPVKNKLILFFEFSKGPNFISSVLGKLLNCSRCLAFWIGIIVFHDVLSAAITGLLGYIIQHIEDKINFWYEQ